MNPPLTDLNVLLELPGLPESSDTLFTPKSKSLTDACLGWCSDDWSLYACGYKEAADLLVQSVVEQRTPADSLVYPVLFLYRQYLELEIKHIIRQCFRLLGNHSEFPRHHRIDKLWALCRQLLNDTCPGESVTELMNITRLIREFSAVDPFSMAFRYPEGKDGEPSLPGTRQINLNNVRDVIGKIAFVLGGASDQVSRYCSFEQEMRREFSDTSVSDTI